MDRTPTCKRDLAANAQSVGRQRIRSERHCRWGVFVHNQRQTLKFRWRNTNMPDEVFRRRTLDSLRRRSGVGCVLGGFVTGLGCFLHGFEPFRGGEQRRSLYGPARAARSGGQRERGGFDISGHFDDGHEIVVLRELVIPPAVLEWLGDAVLDSDRTEQATRAASIKKLKNRYDQIEARVETMYLDRLDGPISQDLFDRQAASMRGEQAGLLRKIQDIEKATPTPVDDAIDMVRLTSRASELFLQQAASEQRQLLQTVVQKASWKDGALQTVLFEPFEILRHSNRESCRNEKEKPGSGREIGIWLPGTDSNHDSRMLQTLILAGTTHSDADSGTRTRGMRRHVSVGPPGH
jgi:hypothetical protein